MTRGCPLNMRSATCTHHVVLVTASHAVMHDDVASPSSLLQSYPGVWLRCTHDDDVVASLMALGHRRCCCRLQRRGCAPRRPGNVVDGAGPSTTLRRHRCRCCFRRIRYAREVEKASGQGGERVRRRRVVVLVAAALGLPVVAVSARHATTTCVVVVSSMT